MCSKVQCTVNLFKSKFVGAFMCNLNGLKNVKITLSSTIVLKETKDTVYILSVRFC